MKKIIKKYGTAWVITFTKEERKAWNIKEGDVLDIEICKEEAQNGRNI